MVRLIQLPYNQVLSYIHCLIIEECGCEECDNDCNSALILTNYGII